MENSSSDEFDYVYLRNITRWISQARKESKTFCLSIGKEEHANKRGRIARRVREIPVQCKV